MQSNSPATVAITVNDTTPPVPTVAALDDWVDRSSSARRFGGTLFGAFGAVALILAAAGLYGTLVYTVGQQRRELGIRLALGAGRERVQAEVLRRIAGRFGWAADSEFGLFRQGFIGQTTTVFPLYKIQRVDLRQTPGQRRLGLCHLTVHLASGTETVPYMDVSAGEQLRDLALYHAETDPRPWY